MDIQEVKQKIQKFADEKYNGSFRTLKPKLMHGVVGENTYKEILSMMSEDIKKSHSLIIHCFMNDIYTFPLCACGHKVKFNTTTKKFMKYCSNTCRFEYFNESVNVRKETNIKKYGHTNVLASKYGKSKILDTNLTKYGVKSYTQTDEYKQSVVGRKSSPETIKKVQDAHRKTFFNSLIIKHPNFTPLFTLEEYQGVKGYIQYKWLCGTCNKEFMSSCDNGSSPVCTHCKPVGSKHELVVRNYLDSLGIDFKYNWRELPSKKEIDVYIPNKNLGFELCGLYWHSTACSSYGVNDHINKMNECKSQGIDLITIFDDEMYQKPKIVLNRIRAKLGLVKRKIYARKCEVVEIDSKFSKKFLNKYHIQGAIGGKFRYGLRYKNRIVAVMTFNKGRLATGNSDKDGVYELGRYCTVANFSIVGGAGKLFKHFTTQEEPSQVYSFSDNRWNSGGVYKQIGMNFVKDTKPNYYYTKDFKSKLHRVNFQKGKLKKFSEYNPLLTEEEIMKREKYFRIYDCGSKLFEWNSPT